MTIIALVLKYWRWFLFAGIIIVLAILVGTFSHARYAAGEAAGRAAVQARWDAQAREAKQAYDAAAAATQEKIQSDRAAALEVERGLRENLAAADAGGRSLSQRLRLYERSLARCRSLPSPAGNAGDSPGEVGSVSGDAEIERLSDAAWAACARDGVRLDRIEQWRVKVTP